MTERDYQAKLDELDRLLNDPEVRMDPDRIWTLLAEISTKDLAQQSVAATAAVPATAAAAAAPIRT